MSPTITGNATIINTFGHTTAFCHGNNITIRTAGSGSASFVTSLIAVHTGRHITLTIHVPGTFIALALGWKKVVTQRFQIVPTASTGLSPGTSITSIIFISTGNGPASVNDTTIGPTARITLTTNTAPAGDRFSTLIGSLVTTNLVTTRWT